MYQITWKTTQPIPILSPYRNTTTTATTTYYVLPTNYYHYHHTLPPTNYILPTTLGIAVMMICGNTCNQDRFQKRTHVVKVVH
jgi:hypothetical protein